MITSRRRVIWWVTWSLALATVLVVVMDSHYHRNHTLANQGEPYSCLCRYDRENTVIEKQGGDDLVKVHVSGSEHTVVSRNVSHTHPLVFYNRVPKCGSSALLDIIRKLAVVNQFRFSRSTLYMKFWEDETNTTLLVHKLNFHVKPLLYERHFHFLDFTRYGMAQPVYINLIRDPVDRLASWYYFRRFQNGHIRNMSLEDRIRSYDECVLGEQPECILPQGDNAEEGYYKIIPFFCGQNDFCREPTPKALQQAIENVRKYYTLVGVTELYSQFVEVLEAKLPGYFTGASHIYNSTEGEMRKKHSTMFKLPVLMETRRKLYPQLQLEYRFYDYVKTRFLNQYHNMRGR